MRTKISPKTWASLILFLVLFCIVGVIFLLYQRGQRETNLVQRMAHLPFSTNIISETEKNTFFRKVLFTGTQSQLVVMDIPPGGEAGEETHKFIEQTLFFMSGTGKAVLDGKESSIVAGDVVVVTPGTKHNFINTGTSSLKIYTVYSPPNHIDGRTHITKADADKDAEDEAFGELQK